MQFRITFDTLSKIVLLLNISTYQDSTFGQGFLKICKYRLAFSLFYNIFRPQQVDSLIRNTIILFRRFYTGFFPFSSFIFFFILITCLLEIALIFQGEIMSWSFTGVEGLIKDVLCLMLKSTRTEPCLFLHMFLQSKMSFKLSFLCTN